MPASVVDPSRRPVAALTAPPVSGRDYGGLVAIGLHVVVGRGSYSLFALSNQLHLNPFLLLPAAAVFAVVFALVSAWPMLRLSGAYFAVGTWVLRDDAERWLVD
jgi:hypothetical protein